METITIAQSFLRNGLWQAADWRAQVVNDETGEILLTAVTGDDESMIGVRLTTQTVRQLRELTAFAEANMRRDEAEEAEDYDCRMLTERVDALERAATPAIANRVWMDEVERQIARLEATVNKLDKQISSLHEHQVLDARRVDALESKLAQTQQRLMETERDGAQAELALRKRVERLEDFNTPIHRPLPEDRPSASFVAVTTHHTGPITVGETQGA